jgi:catechol 2,3-dioxygenase-like lactoylglutathione lyase family enzyme
VTVVRALDCICIVVSSSERAVAWQERVLGATRHDGSVAAVGATSFRFSEPAGGSQPRTAPPANEVGGCHVCIGVPDVEAEYRRLLAHDVSTSTAPVELLPALWSVYFTDPDGVRYQFLQRPGPPALHHFAYSVSDLDRTVAWYETVFGAVPGYRGEASGDLVSRTLEVVDGAYRAALVPLGGLQLELMEWLPSHPASSAGSSGAVGDWSIGLRVADLAALREKLGDADGVAHVGEGFVIEDPDGMRLVVRRLLTESGFSTNRLV